MFLCDSTCALKERKEKINGSEKKSVYIFLSDVKCYKSLLKSSFHCEEEDDNKSSNNTQ